MCSYLCPKSFLNFIQTCSEMQHSSAPKNLLPAPARAWFSFYTNNVLTFWHIYNSYMDIQKISYLCFVYFRRTLYTA